MDWDIVDIFNFLPENQELDIGIQSILLRESSFITTLPQTEDESSSWKPSKCISPALELRDSHQLSDTMSCLEEMEVPRDMFEEPNHSFNKNDVPISPPDNCSSDSSLRDKQLHTGNNNLQPRDERPFRCAICPKAFRLSSTLSAHKKLHDQRGPSLRCETCGRAFTQPSALSSHRLLHRSDRPHSCSLCGKQFVRLHALKTHVLSHANERPYECDQCGKAFTEKHVLVRHRKTHSDERPHECAVCSKAFKERYDLLRHTLIHSGLRPHKCPDCSKTFVQSNALVKHRKSHERERTVGHHPLNAASFAVTRVETTYWIRNNSVREQLNLRNDVKDKAKAAQLRSEGKKMFHPNVKRYIEAIKLYNESIAFSEKGSTERALAYANRSNICLKMQRFEDCLENFRLARESNYPGEKLNQREKEAKNALAKARNKNASSSKVTPDVVEEPELSYAVKENAPQLKVGDVVMIERPFVTVLKDSLRYVRCDFCHEERPFTLIPCEGCTMAMYCSEECLSKAYNKYHRYECGLLLDLREVFLEVPLIAIRMVAIAITTFDNNPEALKDHLDVLDESNVNGFTMDWNKATSQDIFNSVHVLTNNQERRDSFSVAFYIFNATILHTLILERTELGPVCEANPATNKILLDLILRYLRSWNLTEHCCPLIRTSFNFLPENQELDIGIQSILLRESSFITTLPQTEDESSECHNTPMIHSSSSWKPSKCISPALELRDSHQLSDTMSCLEEMEVPRDMLEEPNESLNKAAVPISPPDNCSWDSSLRNKQLNTDNNNLQPDDERPFQCAICPKAFRLSSTLSAHKKLHDQRGPSLRCETCGRAFTQPSALSSHRLLHRSDRPHSCSLCGKQFVRLHALKTHVLSHANERPYECAQCGKAFTEKHVLVRHRKTHSDERPHECAVCSKAFKERYDLLRHTLIHSGLRPHKCPDCSKTFVQSNALVKHRKCHERERTVGHHPLNAASFAVTRVETTCC
ncbi:uncharacterized protein LOC121599014 [Anopheles merus]|uniref:uncharacterized protein LOC121599014 n=1 Tax=Anopheles merus TaxID=30066 RepID=UPI001BE49251|nr:uncharacterized protein LOC121599014 [Anopheles merus]